MKPNLPILLWATLCLVTVSGPLPAAEPAGAIQSSNWGLSGRDSYDASYNYGWSFTRAPEFRPTNSGVELILCYEWNCNQTISWLWETQHLAKISRKIARCATSAENELLALRNAIRDTEERVRRKLPIFNGDIGGNLKDKNNPGRLDCVDNSSNTNTFLRILEQYRPFRYWQVSKPQRDGLFNPHLSATLMTRDSDFIDKYRSKTLIGDKDYSVWTMDSWLTTFAHKPFVMELNDWRKKLDPWGNTVYLRLYEKELSCW